MTRRRLGRKAVLVTGLGAAALLVSAASINWHGLAASYHLHLLNRDPGRIAGLLRAPATSPKRLAVRAYLTRPEGRSAFLTFLLDQFDEARPALASIAGLSAANQAGPSLKVTAGARAETLRSAWEVLDLLVEQEIALAGDRTLRLVLVRWVGGTEQKLIPGYWSGYVLEPPFPGESYVCLARREGAGGLAATPARRLGRHP